MPLAPGDEVVLLGHAYGAVRKAAGDVTAAAGAWVMKVPLPLPHPTAAAVLAALGGAITPRSRLAAQDHITSPSALVLPVEDFAAMARVVQRVLAAA